MIEFPASSPWFVGVQFHPNSPPIPHRPSAVHRLCASGCKPISKRRQTMKLCGFEAGLDQPFFLIAGPCLPNPSNSVSTSPAA